MASFFFVIFCLLIGGLAIAFIVRPLHVIGGILAVATFIGVLAGIGFLGYVLIVMLFQGTDTTLLPWNRG